MAKEGAEARLEVNEMEHQATVNGVEQWLLRTNAGAIPIRFHPAAEGNTAILWVGEPKGAWTGQPADCTRVWPVS